MLAYNEIKERKFIVLEGEPYEVLESHVFRKQQRKPVNQTKLRHLVSGSVKQISFHQSETVEEADIGKKTITYSFSKFNNQSKTEEFWFFEGDDKSKRFSLGKEIIGSMSDYMKENTKVTALTFNDEIIGIEIPIKVELKVKEAPPNVKGNSAAGADKRVTLETGAMITVPMFVEAGDIVRINTETGQYVERV